MDRDNYDIQTILNESVWIKLREYVNVPIDSEIMQACIKTKTKAKIITEINKKPYVKNEHKNLVFLCNGLFQKNVRILSSYEFN